MPEGIPPSSPLRCRIQNEGLVLRVCRRERNRHKVQFASEAYTIIHAREGVDNNRRSLAAPSILQSFQLRCDGTRPSVDEHISSESGRMYAEAEAEGKAEAEGEGEGETPDLGPE
jgi:hypothetical protein